MQSEAVTKLSSIERISEDSHQVKNEGYSSILETTSYNSSAEVSTSIVLSIIAYSLINTYGN